MSPIASQTQVSNVTEGFLREHEKDIVRLSLNAVKKYTRVPNDFMDANKDEFLNEMRLKVWLKYDAKRGALSTFVHKCAINLINRMYGQFCANDAKRVSELPTMWMSQDGSHVKNHGEKGTPIVDRVAAAKDPSGGIDEVVNAVWASSLAKEKMTDREAQVFGLMNSGVTRSTDIAEVLGVSDQRVAQIKKRIAEIVKADQDAVLEAAGALSFGLSG